MSRVVRRLAAIALILGLAHPAMAQTTVRYVHTDALGSVLAMTDENRIVVERREYEPYGQQLAALEDGPGYTGHVQDAASGLTYMQQRYFDPEIGKFLSIDPVTTNPNTGANFNRYAYANGNPYKFVDPDGRNSCTKNAEAALMCASPETAGGITHTGGGSSVAPGFWAGVLTWLGITAASESGEGDAGTAESSQGEVVIGEKIKGQLEDRGWTEDGVREAVAGEASGTTVDNTGGKVGSAGEPASVYGSPEGGYVIVNDETKVVIQVAPSTETDPGWQPDPRINWDKK